MPIDSTHNEYGKNREKWQKINDICDGENLDNYIVYINQNDQSRENVERNTQFRKRAVFYEIAGYTARGLNGMLFRKWPKLEIPEEIDYVKNNVDGAGVSIYQQSQTLAKDLIRNGRGGLWVDFPKTEETTVSKRDIEERKVFATIQRYSPEQIINWSVKYVGARVKLSLVIIKDVISTVETKDYSTEEKQVIIELFLDEQEIYNFRKWEEINGKWQIIEETQPKKADGSTWDEIPFMFVGSETNTPSVDNQPLMAIVRVNIGHYNNSASYEDSVFISGQPQPWISGVNRDEFAESGDDKIIWGSNRIILVPEGGQVGIVQSSPNSMAREAMRDKTELAVGLGAMFITPGSANKTATQAEGEKEVQHSVLSLIASNVSEAYTQCLHWVNWYMSMIIFEKMEYTINQDFVSKNATPQDLQHMAASLMQGAIPPSDYIAWAKKYGFVDPEKSDEDVLEQLNIFNMPNLEPDDGEQ